MRVCWFFDMSHYVLKLYTYHMKNTTDKILDKQHTRNSGWCLNEFPVKMTNNGFALFC